MNRRALLATLGASIASCSGCLSAASGAGPASTRDGSTPTFEASEVQRHVSLGSVDDTPDADVALDVKLLNGTVTSEDPARLRVTVENSATTAKRLTNNEGQCALFNRGGGASDPEGVHIYQPDFPGYTGDCAQPDRQGNLWRLDRPTSKDCRVLSYGCETVMYEAGEMRSTQYQLWDDHTADGYIPADTYRFEEQISIGEEDESFDWGFSLVVESPE